MVHAFRGRPRPSRTFRPSVFGSFREFLGFPQRVAPPPMEEVRASSAWVASRASHVVVDSSGSLPLPPAFDSASLFFFFSGFYFGGYVWVCVCVCAHACDNLGRWALAQGSRGWWRPSGTRFRRWSGISKGFTTSTVALSPFSTSSSWMLSTSASGLVNTTGLLFFFFFFYFSSYCFVRMFRQGSVLVVCCGFRRFFFLGVVPEGSGRNVGVDVAV